MYARASICIMCLYFLGGRILHAPNEAHAHFSASIREAVRVSLARAGQRKFIDKLVIGYSRLIRK